MSGQIFISYRRQESQWSARSLHDRLCRDFDPEQIFMNIDAIPVDEDFVKAIETTVEKCDVLIAVIGNNWLASKDDRGDRRLDDPEDFVRKEIGTALKREIRVIPVLVDGALLPSVTDLPEDLKPLARLDALSITDISFDRDCQNLVAAIRQVSETSAGERLIPQQAAVAHRDKERLILKDIHASAILGVSAKASEMEIEAAYRDRSSAVRKQFNYARDRMTREKCKREHDAIEEARSKLLRNLEDQEQRPRGENQHLAAEQHQREESHRLAAEQHQREESHRLEAEQWEKRKLLLVEANARHLLNELASDRFPKGVPVFPHACVLEHHPVDCTIFAPDRVRRDVQALLQVFLHTPEGRELATEIALNFDSGTKARGHRSLVLDAPTGAIFSFDLEIEGFVFSERVGTLLWTGQPQSVAFPFTVPAGCKLGQHMGVARIWKDGTPVGRISFQIEVVREAPVANKRPAGEEARHYRSCFCSYSSFDRVEMLKRAQGLQASGLETFIDVLNLRPGDKWDPKIFAAIDDCDLFVVIWSTNARNSKWVKKESSYALKRYKKRGIPDFRPIPVEGPPIPPVPRGLRAYHFNDELLSLIRAAQA
jgi:hypothetical protein